ncbi:MAG TPA: hypothetical protein VIH76_16010 [Candidatus Acidoferrales bacterium]
MLAITHVPYDGVLGDLSDELQTMTMNEIRVQCYSGFKADERPQKFTLRGRDFIVQEVDDQWYSPAAVYFRVLADDGNYYVLRHDEEQDSWTLDAFRAAR